MDNKIKIMNKQKFIHYVMVTFTYSVGVGTAGLILFAAFTVLTN